MSRDKKKMCLDVEYSHYGENVTDYKTGESKGGQRFISVNSWYDNGGSCGGCDSREEALESLKRAVNIDCYGNKMVLREKDIILDDKTDLKFTVGEILGQSLGNWFDCEKPKLTQLTKLQEREQYVKEHNERCEEARQLEEDLVAL